MKTKLKIQNYTINRWKAKFNLIIKNRQMIDPQKIKKLNQKIHV